MSMKGILKEMVCLLLLMSMTGNQISASTGENPAVPLNVKIPLNNVMDPRAFFIGTVQREYISDQTKETARQINFRNYLSENSKTITSVTNELKWNYVDGIATVNTPNAQGATGFLNKREKLDFKDISFVSNNEFSTLIAISLDGIPLAESKKILVQAMTQDQLYGYDEKKVYTNTGEYQGKKEITSLGVPPWNVKNIEASFVIKNAKGLVKISVLDENGYMREELSWEKMPNGSARVTLKPNSIYTVIERDVENSEIQKPIEKPLHYIWWEGEDYLETNFPEETEFSESTFPEDKKDVLSGGKWLTNAGVMQEGDETPYIKYQVNVKNEGDYNFFIRRFWKHGPFMYRFDDGEWVKFTEITLADSITIRKFLEVNWVSVGDVHLDSGTHTLEIRQINKEGKELSANEQKVACYDAFLLVNGPFTPLGLIKPGEKLTNAIDGFFPFSPEVDTYMESPIDLRYLNEEKAGQDGYMYSEGDKLYLANGKEVRLWATNVGDVMFADNATIDNFTRKMAKYGINMIRMHKGVLDSDLNISDTKVDRIQYFVNSCKNNGIYTKFSFYFVLGNNLHLSKEFAHNGRFENNLVEGFLEHQKEGFAYIIWNEKMQNTYLDSMEKLLKAENPYGETPLIFEPSLAIIEVQNEDSFFFGTSGAWRWPQADQYRFAKIFGAWLIDKYGSINKTLKEWGSIQAESPRTYPYDNYANGAVSWIDVNDFGYSTTRLDWENARKKDFRTFLIELQKGFYEKMINRFHDMGYEGMTIASNWTTLDNSKYDAIERYTYLPADINDNHAYNNNFSGLENAPNDTTAGHAVVAGQKFFDKSVLLEPERCAVRAVTTLGQPSVISEIAWTNPTHYSAEGPFIEAAYASLQGIDGIMNFAANPDWSATLQKFPQNNPSFMGQFPAFALMYRRGDVSEAQVIAYESISPKSMYENKKSRVFNGVNMDGYRKNN